MTPSTPIAKRRLAAALATAAACLLTATGCDGSEATPPPSPSTGASTPPSSTPSTPATTPKAAPPTMPPAASAGFTVSSADAFARFYLAAREHAALTGDVALLRKWANRTCTVCKALADGYEAQYKAGGSITGDVRFRVAKVDRARLVGNEMAEVVLTGRIGRFVDIDRRGATPGVYPGGTVTYRLGLIRTGGQWRVFAMVVKD